MTLAIGSQWRGRLDPVVMALVFYVLTSCVVLIGVGASTEVVYRASDYLQQDDFIQRCANWDGRAYQAIATQGYEHAPGRPHGNVAFWPTYPLIGHCVAALSGLRCDLALLIVSHLSLAGAFVLMALYTRQRYPEAPPEVAEYTLLVMGLLPTTVFFRMAYAESLFLLLGVTTLYGIGRHWPVALVAAVAGLATATRPPGIAFVVPVVLYAWHRLNPQEDAIAVKPVLRSLGAGSMPAVRCIPVLLISCWGLAAFMIYQWLTFDDPLACAKAQASWRLSGGEDTSYARKAVAMLWLEPMWSVYIPRRPEFWARYEPHGNPVFSLQFANPLFFAGTIAAVVVGWRRGILNSYETLAAAGLLVVPYVTKSHDNAMASFGRFAAVAIPVYPVIGWALTRLGGPLSAALLVISGLFLGVYSALFALWYRII